MTKENCEYETEHESVVRRAKENMPTAKNLESVCNTFRIIGEPSRMKIVLALLQGEMCVYHIVEACGGTQSAVSHQLRVLKDNRVIKSRRMVSSSASGACCVETTTVSMRLGLPASSYSTVTCVLPSGRR